ncbi:MAG TPA: MarR family transcriptional regulator [Stellaceae bacterium]|nr:MarR family transcriptional regulator [Stellaceae bacterium]
MSPDPVPEIDPARDLDTVIHLFEAFRALDPDMPIQYALSFLTLARNEGLSMGELAQRLGIAQSSASRNVAALSKWHSFGKAGHDLVEAREDPRERRRKLIRLTPAGRQLVASLSAIVAGKPSVPADPRAAGDQPARPPRPIGHPVRG